MITLADSLLFPLAQAGGGGLSINWILIILAIIVIVADFFFFTDLLTHVGYILLCVVIFRVLPGHPLIRALAGLVVWFAIVYAHYKFFRDYIQNIANRDFAPDQYRAGAESLIGETGTVRIVEDVKMVMVKGDLWDFTCGEELAEDTQVRVESVEDAKLRVSRAS